MRTITVSTCLIALLVAGCAMQRPASVQVQGLVWPAAPETPRIAFVRTFERAEDLGIERGLLRRLGDLLFGSEDLRLIRPMAVVVSGELVYVADPGIRGVHRFDRVGGRHDVIRLAGDRPLPSPVGLALGDSGQVFVTDSALRKVFVVTAQASFAAEVDLQAELRQPTGIAADKAGPSLWIVDTGMHRIQQFGPHGRAIATIGRRGDGDGEFNYPTLLWRDAKGSMYVSDSMNFRVQIFDARGSFIGKFGRHGDGIGDLARHKGVATDSRGHVYVVDGMLHAMQVFDHAGRLLIAVGGLGSDNGEFRSPAGLFIAPDDTIYVADAYNRRVQVFRYVGGDE